MIFCIVQKMKMIFEGALPSVEMTCSCGGVNSRPKNVPQDEDDDEKEYDGDGDGDGDDDDNDDDHDDDCNGDH